MKKVVVIFISVVIGTCVYAQTPGSLDLTFGGTGIVVTPVGNFNDDATSIAIQSDGKIIVAGQTYLAGGWTDFAVVRYNTDGTIDNDFGINGKVTTSIGNFYDYLWDVAIQSDGKIVVAGYTMTAETGGHYDIALVRYNPNGTLDNTFGTGGIVTTDMGGGSSIEASGIALQTDGKIVVGGGANGGFAVVRYNTNGTLDNSFGSGGIVMTSIGTGGGNASAISLQTDGKIVVTGPIINYPYNLDFAVVRYNTSGTIDNTFGTNGIVITTITSNTDEPTDLVIQPDGKIVVSGHTFDGSVTSFAVVRYNSNGSLDNNFGPNGIVITSIGSFGASQANAIAIQTDGKIVVAGITDTVIETHYYFNFSIARYSTNGTLDNSFGTGGIVITSIGLNSEASDVGIQADGKIVVAGSSPGVSSSDFTVARYMGDSTTSSISDKKNTPLIVRNIFPNPAKDKCTIYIEGKEKAIITIDLYNSFGIKVMFVLNERKTLGDYSTTLDISDFEAGVYYFKIKAFIFEDNSTFSVVKKIIVLR